MQDRGGSARPPGRSNPRMNGDERRQANAGQGVGGDRQLDNSINQQNISINQVLKCPRCDSLNTKFCYYNNYSLLQPRHFCKNCRRYWTKGGALRDVPIGGGCRKNKRTSASSSSSATPSKQRLSNNPASSNSTVIAAAPAVQIPTVHRRQNDFSPISNTSLLQPSAALLETSLSSATTPTARLPTSQYNYSLHRNNNINSMDADKTSFPFASRPLNQPTLRLSDHLGQISANPSLNSLSNPGLNPLAHTSLSLLNLQSRSSSATNHLAALSPSTLASRSNHFSSFGALSLRNGLMGLDFNAADYSQQPSLHPTLLSPAAISEDLDPGRHLNPSASTVPSTVTDTNDILSSFSLALDRFDSTNQDDEQWKSHHQQRIKLPNQSDNQQQGQLRGQLQALLPFENQAMEGVMQQLSHEQLTKPGLMPDNCKVKGEDPPVDENWSGQEGFIEPSVDANYWNNASTWPDLSTYGPSTTPLL